MSLRLPETEVAVVCITNTCRWPPTTPCLVGRAKKRSERAQEEMTENSFPKTDSEMTDWGWGGQIGYEQLLTRSTLVGEIVISSRVEIDSDILPQLQEI